MSSSLGVMSCIGLLLPASAAAAAGQLGEYLRTGGHEHHSHMSSQGFGGDSLERTFTQYKDIPIDEAQLVSKNWIRHSPPTTTPCDPNLGYAWTEDYSGPTQTQPLIVYTTKGGQLSGVGMMINLYGNQKNRALIKTQKKFMTQDPVVASKSVKDAMYVDVAFRKGDIVCNGDTDDTVKIGTNLIVNPAGASVNASYEIPLSEKEVDAAGWHRGSCFDGMGWHWFLDTAVGKNKMSWKADNLFPIVAMYDKGEINAIFFATMINQVTIPLLKTNEWEPKSLSNPQMCMNLCDDDCTFEGLTPAGPWSTAHIYFRDHKEVKCDKTLDCKLKLPFGGGRAACCDQKGTVLV